MSEKLPNLTAYEQLVLDELRAARADVKALRRVIIGDADVVGLVRKVDRLRWQMRLMLALVGLVLATGKSDHAPIAATVIKAAAAQTVTTAPTTQAAQADR